MAAEKRNPSGSQSIVDQDAAITAYLDGLLRDPEQDEAPESSRSRKSPGLTVVNNVEAAESVVADEPVVDTPAESAEEEAPTAAEAPADPVVADEPESFAEETGSREADDEDEATDMAAVVASEDEGNAEPVAEEAAATDESASLDTATPVAAIGQESMALDEPAEASPWAWLRVGGMTLALPAEAVVSRHVDATLEPVPGAPEQVAGALTVDGRPRLILSLSTVTGARCRGDATEVLLLGNGGLWGVVAEPVSEAPSFDEDAVQWRSEAQKNERRGWLAGTAPSAGVAVLDVAGLRAALKGSR
ncbi:chemotaxis protein CheW [Guyparkeria hydrothermalis]|uniref:chemotaxis protein CheW n=1 Tax=Guyparkeria hydrothermalis TaxID=923 RepID=UPI00201FC67E|nr:chemotaxis protein CheW [Guyparkeria hydrothermalis]MCL7745425.1 chemotaxis protein CheW [Guyparkeria hydrothermalis]